jgi:hypothetical protein
VVVFDKQTWPSFEQIWEEQGGSYTDPAEGTRVKIYSTTVTKTSGNPQTWPFMEVPIGNAIVIYVTDTNGDYGSVRISEDDRRAHSDMKEAIKRISDYLNQSP